MKVYPLTQLYEEMAFIAYHFHWSYSELMELEHSERRRWCRQISKINRQLNDKQQTSLEDFKEVR